jgi:hypothetical protein
VELRAIPVFENIRNACRHVAAQSRWVEIRADRMAAYANSLPLEEISGAQMDWSHHFRGEPEETVAYFLTLAAVNFGSGYFPHLTKASGMTGYYTTATRLKQRFDDKGPFSSQELVDMDADSCSRLFHQPTGDLVIDQLMDHFSRAFRQLGRLLQEDFQGSFVQLVTAAEGSAARLVAILSQMPYFDDRQKYGGRNIPFFKRSQLAAADLSLAFEGRGLGRFFDLDQLTLFADNLVPHVLRMDGILAYQPELLERINAGILIPPGSPEEVELRACAVHAVELLRATPAAAESGATAQRLDYLLWHRGQQKQYKAVPRHRTRTIYY